VTYPVSTFSSKWIGDDFYTWVNKEWISDTTIPPFEADFGASEEIEDCIEDVFTSIFNDIVKRRTPTTEETIIQNIHASFYHNRTESLLFVKEHIERVNCIQSVRDVLKHMGLLCKYRLPGIFSIDYVNTRNKLLEMSITPNIPGMAVKLYDSPEFMHKYKEFLHKVGKSLNIDKLERIVPFEKKLSQLFDDDEDEKLTSTKGYGLTRKFKLPWDAFFEALGFAKWETTDIFYRYPKMIRKLKTLLNEVPLSMWKGYIIKCYLTPIIQYMGAPFEDFHHEFSGKYLQGKEKPPPKEVFLEFAYETLPEILSKHFWQKCGDQNVIVGAKKIAETIHNAAISRMRENTWLSAGSKMASIEKIKAITYKIGKPATWEDSVKIELDPTNFIKNRFLLGEARTQKMFSYLGKKHTLWEEGIFRVNAYYYSEFNEIVFPYGILVSPFYKKGENPTWNYGGIGATFGHELCHAFDDDGKEYDQYGMVRRWWTDRDIRRYRKKAKALEKVYTSVKVLGKHLDGENTLSENIADIAGLSICLEALRANLASRGIVNQEEIIKEYRIFFISFATSWRTLYRNKRLKSGIATDVHAPAYVRVNKVVSQMDEWYEAFDIDSHSSLYVKPEDRIRFF
jgi:putative endopeptidase